jgi:hypothetical protein
VTADAASKRCCDCLILHPRGLATADAAFKKSCDYLILHPRGLPTAWYCIQGALPF